MKTLFCLVILVGASFADVCLNCSVKAPSGNQTLQLSEIEIHKIPIIYEVGRNHKPSYYQQFYKGHLGKVVHSPIREKNYYLGLHFKANFYEALQFCSYHGMRLASIVNGDENVTLKVLRDKYNLAKEAIWISGSDEANEGKFVWASTGEPITFKHFKDGPANNLHKEENCLEFIEDGLWNDQDCTKKSYFACEY